MNRDFYFYAKLFLGLAVVAGVLQSFLHFLVGTKMFFLGGSMGWFLVTEIITLTASILVLKYYHHQKYWFAFSSGILVIIAHVVFTVVLFVALLERQWESSYIAAIIFGMVAGLVYGASLVISNTRKSPWLKGVGILTIITSVVFALALALQTMRPDVLTNEPAGNLNQWALLASRLIPILFIMQFHSELKVLGGEEQDNVSNKSDENIFAFFAILAMVAVLGFGITMTRQAFQSRYWQNRHQSDARGLVKKSEVRTFVNSNGDSLHYLLTRPLNFDPRKEYPLVVCLPYNAYLAPPAQLLSSHANRAKYPAFLFIPYCPPQASWGGVPERFKMDPMDSLVFEAILSLNDSAIDETRRYVSGVSKGGYGSWHFITAHPEMFAAAIPVCGEGNLELAPRIVDVPVWAFHGEDDRNVPVEGSRDMIEAIRNAGGSPRYTEFPDEAHHIWSSVEKTPGLLDWLFAQKKE